ncbi:MAG TPA: phosphotransferase, partial [Tepidiformaceae bacterium]|nr:phosphotransferase [Tepidiformaceae bacterium]
AGGEFGATLVRTGAGEEFILKLLASEQLLGAVSRGAGLANRLRSAGYPAPEYVRTGTAERFTWSLQRPLPGSMPDVMTVEHAAGLIRLARRHEGFAEDSYDWPGTVRRRSRLLSNLPAGVPAGPRRELAGALTATRYATLRRGDVVHSDFHHRNFLTMADRVNGVFDRELASPGDWRFDVVTLAFWTHVVPSQSTPEARALVLETAHRVCGPEVLAFMTAYLALGNLEFQGRVRPGGLKGFAALVDASVGEWWRAGL